MGEQIQLPSSLAPETRELKLPQWAQVKLATLRIALLERLRSEGPRPDQYADAGNMVSTNTAGETRDGWVLVPRDDDRRSFSDSLLPREMIDAGMAVCEQRDHDNMNYVAGVTTDWDDGMVCVAIYRAMTKAAPPPPLEGAGIDAVEAFEIGYAWRGQLVGQTLEDSRAVGRTLQGPLFDGLEIDLSGWNSFEDADLGICDAKRRIIKALSASPPPLEGVEAGTLPIEAAPRDREIDIYVTGPGSRWIENCRWGKPTGANWGDRYGADQDLPEQWITRAGFALDRRNGVATHWRPADGALGRQDEVVPQPRDEPISSSKGEALPVVRKSLSCTNPWCSTGRLCVHCEPADKGRN